MLEGSNSTDFWGVIGAALWLGLPHKSYVGQEFRKAFSYHGLLVPRHRPGPCTSPVADTNSSNTFKHTAQSNQSAHIQKNILAMFICSSTTKLQQPGLLQFPHNSDIVCKNLWHGIQSSRWLKVRDSRHGIANLMLKIVANHELVGGFNPSEKYESNGIIVIWKKMFQSTNQINHD